MHLHKKQEEGEQNLTCKHPARLYLNLPGNLTVMERLWELKIKPMSWTIPSKHQERDFFTPFTSHHILLKFYSFSVYFQLNCCGPSGPAKETAKDICPRGEPLEELIMKVQPLSMCA